MQKMMELNYKNGYYVLKNIKDEKEEFLISEETLQFDTAKFYKCVFSNIGEFAEVKVINSIKEDVDDVPRDKQVTNMVFETIEQICNGVSKKINESVLRED